MSSFYQDCIGRKHSSEHWVTSLTAESLLWERVVALSNDAAQPRNFDVDKLTIAVCVEDIPRGLSRV
jgi:hypothetical protein